MNEKNTTVNGVIISQTGKLGTGSPGRLLGTKLTKPIGLLVNWAKPVLALFLLLTGCESKEGATTSGGDTTRPNLERTWAVYKADAHSSNYSPLNQINASNVSKLRPAWTVTLDDMPSGSEPGNNECNPIIVDGILYAISAKQITYALNAATGKKLWSFDPTHTPGVGTLSRGVTYWEGGWRDNQLDKRILVTTGGRYLFALDAATGKLISSFGEGGKVDLNVGLRDDPESVLTGPTTPGIIYNDLLILGTQIADFNGSPPGYMRAYNCKTGKLVWTFHTIPQLGEPGYQTWPEKAYQYAGGANDWAGMSLDQKRGIVYLALGSPCYDFYGADRKGENLYGNCVVALDAATGKRIWHFQTVHHDLWDYDLPAPPALVTVRRGGKQIDAVAQITKQGFVFVLNRETGKSLFPIEERPVPASNLPGEKAWPTQPFPLKPKPFARQRVFEKDLTHYSDANHQAILKKFRSLRYEGLYTPPDLKGTLLFPGTRGGGEWGGAAYDPATTTLYIKSTEAPDVITLATLDYTQDKKVQATALFQKGRTLYLNNCAFCHRADKGGKAPNFPGLTALKHKMSREAALQAILNHKGSQDFKPILKGKQKELMAFVYEAERSGMNESKSKTDAQRAATEKYYNTTAYKTFSDPQGNPAIQPPWGTLSALNVSTGEYAWQIPLGNIEKFQRKEAPETGQESKGGPIATAGGLLFIAGTKDNKLRAIDQKTGTLLWQTVLPALVNTTASTYQVQGKQYVVVSVSGSKQNPAGYFMAFTLP